MSWKGIVGQLAPTLGAAFGGPYGAIAGKFLKEKLLGNENASDDELEQAVTNASPEQLLQIKKADYEFKTRMAELGIRKFEAEVDDRKSARSMSADKTPQIILSSVYTVGYFGVLIGLMTETLVIPESQTTLMTALLGVLTAAQIQIMNFWFGSSSGSKDKSN